MAFKNNEGGNKALMVRNLLNECLDRHISKKQVCREKGFHDEYITDFIRKHRLLGCYERGEITKETYEEILDLNEQVNSAAFTPSSIAVSAERVDTGEERVVITHRRDEENRIIAYEYYIPRRDRPPIQGSFTREEMEKIHNEYPHVSSNRVSRGFFNIAPAEFKKILRAFNITKDQCFAPHIIEEAENPDELVDRFYLAKEKTAYQRIEIKREDTLKKRVEDLELKLRKYEDTEDFLHNILEQYSHSTTTRTVNIIPRFAPLREHEDRQATGTLFPIVGDIHFGKHFPPEKCRFNRGNNKDILKERCLRIAYETVDRFYSRNKRDVTMMFLGDVFETLLPDGMHYGHTREMDLVGVDQFVYALEVVEEMVDILVHNLPNDAKITLRSIGGNHDRIEKKRDEDTGRTATAMLFSMVKRILEARYPEGGIFVEHSVESTMAFSEDHLSFIAFHGDNSLYKRKPVEIMNLFKKGDAGQYTVILNGHWHKQCVRDEGMNYLALEVGSVCAPDEYTQNQLGVGTQPNFIIGRRSIGYGFDYERINLY